MFWRRLAAAVLAAAAWGAHAAPTATQVMDWAETQFPDLFPGHQANVTYQQYVYRFYPASGNYLGVAGSDIYVFGNVVSASSVPVRVGSIADYACGVLPSSCAWLNLGGDAQHSGLSGLSTATQPFSRIAWRSDIDLQPLYRPLVSGDPDNTLATGHYGGPVITPSNTVIAPIRVNDTSFRIEARSGADGALRWQSETDYISPLAGTAYSAALTPGGRVYFAGAGGKLYYRDNVDGTPGPVQTVVFYGASAYEANKAAMDSAVYVTTPLTIDSAGTVYFGYLANANPIGLAGGIARIDAAGNGSWVSAAAATGVSSQVKVPIGAAPALSLDGATVYAATASAPSPTSRRGTGYLVALDAATLATRNKAALADAMTGWPEIMTDVSSASPAVAPDGDVYYGILGDRNNLARHPSHGWLLHFDSTLATRKKPGAFGWDHTPSFVPSSLVGGYTGTSPYLIVSKYNNYTTGLHRMAVLDPAATQSDSYGTSTITLKEVITLLSPTLITTGNHAGEYNEWCINTVAVDPLTASAFMNSSDGYLYRWSLANNTIAERISLNQGYYQSYTPTAIGPDGKVYSINNAVLNAVGR